MCAECNVSHMSAQSMYLHVKQLTNTEILTHTIRWFCILATDLQATMKKISQAQNFTIDISSCTMLNYFISLRLQVTDNSLSYKNCFFSLSMYLIQKKFSQL